MKIKGAEDVYDFESALNYIAELQGEITFYRLNLEYLNENGNLKPELLGLIDNRLEENPDVLLEPKVSSKSN